MPAPPFHPLIAALRRSASARLTPVSLIVTALDALPIPALPATISGARPAFLVRGDTRTHTHTCMLPNGM